jgi:aminopeptidase N
MLRCEVSAPDAGVKAAAWEKFQTGPSAYGSLHLTGAAMGGFHYWAQRDLLAPYVERYFEALPGIFEREEREFSGTYFSNLWPSYLVDRPTLERAQRLLAATPESSTLLRRSLREAIDDLERAVKCREFAAS